MSPRTLALDHLFASPGVYRSGDRLVDGAQEGDVVGEVDELALATVLEDEVFGLFG